MDNKVKETLFSLGICSEESLYQLYDKTRDSNDVKVIKCKKSGVIFLDTSEYKIQESYYEEKSDLKYWDANSLKEAQLRGYDENVLRASYINDFVQNKTWLDFGTGSGGILSLLKDKTKNAYGVELQEGVRNLLVEEGYKVFRTIEEVPQSDIDLITLFHVFEHLLDPLDYLRMFKEKMKSRGKIVIEVPHANDILLSLFDLDDFKKFTFWSEHLILHTRETLTRFLEAAGFTNVIIKGIQRYPVSNHLHWLKNGRPGGHVELAFLNNPELTTAYQNTLAAIDKTDTLLAIAEKP